VIAQGLGVAPDPIAILFVDLDGLSFEKGLDPFTSNPSPPTWIDLAPDRVRND